MLTEDATKIVDLAHEKKYIDVLTVARPGQVALLPKVAAATSGTRRCANRPASPIGQTTASHSGWTNRQGRVRYLDRVSYTRDGLAGDLRNLGLGAGDVALVRVAMKAIGRPAEGRPTDVLISALLDVVGDDGTILGLAHTEAVERRDRSAVFRRDTPCITGGFAAAMLEWKGAYRSRHPTNSMVGIGRQAESLLEDHGPNSTCFGPMRKLIDADAKMILIGCVESSPGFSTVHLVYEEVGLAHKCLLSGLYGSYYEHDGEVRWFSKRDVPGCSMGFGNFYPLYRERGVLAAGTVGDAESMLIRCRDAYEVEFDAVSVNPRISLCDQRDCFSCRGTKLFNISDMPRFYAAHPRALADLMRAELRRAGQHRH